MNESQSPSVTVQTTVCRSLLTKGIVSFSAVFWAGARCVTSPNEGCEGGYQRYCNRKLLVIGISFHRFTGQVNCLHIQKFITYIVKDVTYSSLCQLSYFKFTTFLYLSLYFIMVVKFIEVNIWFEIFKETTSLMTLRPVLNGLLLQSLIEYK